MKSLGLRTAPTNKFAVGDPVHVWSRSENRWFTNGTVTLVSADGSIKVSYGKSSKTVQVGKQATHIKRLVAAESKLFAWTSSGIQKFRGMGLLKEMGRPAAGETVSQDQLALVATHGFSGPGLLKQGYVQASKPTTPHGPRVDRTAGAESAASSSPFKKVENQNHVEKEDVGRNTSLDEENESVDEESEHAALDSAIPRSEATALAGLGILGIVPVASLPLEEEQPDSDDDSTDDGDDIFDDFAESLQPSRMASVCSGMYWRIIDVKSRAALLDAGRMRLQAVARSSGCIVELDSDRDVVLIMAQSESALEKARSLLSAQFPSADETSALPEEFQEDDGPHSVEVSWDSHPCNDYYENLVHVVARPSFSMSTKGTSQKPRRYQPVLTARRFRYQLDGIQSRSIACLEYRESVLVCAPTSAGKTAVAEYAIAMALQAGMRTIYTSPIKALSNQKFLELSEVFGHNRLGLLTGDTAIAADAPVLVMTLEILQAMLFKQARDPHLLDDFMYVVLDEAHFLGNVERGHAWEEVLILLPQHIRLVMLSATVPNRNAIASWVAQVRVEPVHVVTSDRRPIPLTHELFRCGPPEFESGRKRSFFRVYARNGKFLADNLDLAVWQRSEILRSLGRSWCCPPELVGRLIGRRGSNLRELTEGLSVNVRIVAGEIQVHGVSDESCKEVETRIGDWLYDHGVPENEAYAPEGMSAAALATEDLERLLCLLAHRRHLPAIGFCFDRRMCEQVALALACAKRMDFTSWSEKSAMRKKIAQGVQGLDKADRGLAQIRNCQELLLRGIGVHHGGMLPLLRELVEILFKSGLLKVVFATETFAIGLNMPARSVIFVDVVKFDGTMRRVLDAGEFRQMSGRAGRRGIDSEGFVYMMLRETKINNRTAQDVFREVYTSDPPEVQSHYRLRWASLLHLICTGPAHVHFMLHRSFLVSAQPSIAQALQNTSRSMLRVLSSLDYIDESGAALPKGSIARRLMVPEDALFVTQIVIALRGFVHLTPPQAFALCACFVADGPPDDSGNVSDKGVRACIQLAKKIALDLANSLHREGLKCCQRCIGAACSGEEFVQSRVRPKLAETAFRWASGEDFTTAVQHSGITAGGEGIVVRGLRRLDELMRELTFVLRTDLGIASYAQQIQETRQRVRRGVLVAQSIYLGEAEDHAGEELEIDPPWPQPTINVGQIGLLDPLDIGFSHSTCNSRYRDGRSVQQLVIELCHGKEHVMNVEQLEVYWFRHRYYTLGNRRLAAYRLWRLTEDKPVCVPVKAVDRSRALAWGWLQKFTTGFTGGRKARIRGTDKYVGMTREESTYLNELADLATTRRSRGTRGVAAGSVINFGSKTEAMPPTSNRHSVTSDANHMQAVNSNVHSHAF